MASFLWVIGFMRCQLSLQEEASKTTEAPKMEHEYTVSKNVIEKIRRGLELESAAMDRDIETEYETLLSSELQKVFLN